VNSSFFRARKTGRGLEVTGSPVMSFGHRVPYGRSGVTDGIFAEWSWDGQRLTVRNDRYGFYPLFYHHSPGEICVSPSIATLVEQGATTELDASGLSVFFRLGFFLGEDTPFRGIRALPPNARFEWAGGELTNAGESRITTTPLPLSRDAAIDTYVDLFRQAIQRRPPGGEFAVPLSGGCDSRHIVLELHAQGRRPAFCITTRRLPPHNDEDVRIATRLAKDLEIDHVVVDQPASRLTLEEEKNRQTHFCSDEHAWFLTVSDRLRGRVDTIYDGIAGDVLSAGLFLTPERVRHFAGGRSSEIAKSLIASMAVNSEELLRSLLEPRLCVAAGRDIAIERLAREAERHLDAPSPAGSFFFWNRTRREIALAPYAIFSHVQTTYAPFVDHDVFDFLTALPSGFFLDHTFHAEAIRRAYPRFAHVPYADKNAPGTDERSHLRGFGRELAWRMLGKRPPRMMRTAFLLPRLASCVLSGRHSPWYLVLATYLNQLEVIAREHGSGLTVSRL
jgi:asparagine synthase (glutamine-hydrolysing)